MPADHTSVICHTNGLGNARSAAELDASRAPLWICDVHLHIADAVLKGHYAHWIRVRLSKDRPQSGNFLRSLQVNFFAEHLDVSTNPINTDSLDFSKLAESHSGLVAEIKP
jgi:hypothetical protein